MRIDIIMYRSKKECPIFY